MSAADHKLREGLTTCREEWQDGWLLYSERGYQAPRLLGLAWCLPGPKDHL